MSTRLYVAGNYTTASSGCHRRAGQGGDYRCQYADAVLPVVDDRVG
jgi:hypothetical protein